MPSTAEATFNNLEVWWRGRGAEGGGYPGNAAGWAAAQPARLPYRAVGLPEAAAATQAMLGAERHGEQDKSAPHRASARPHPSSASGKGRARRPVLLARHSPRHRSGPSKMPVLMLSIVGVLLLALQLRPGAEAARSVVSARRNHVGKEAQDREQVCVALNAPCLDVCARCIKLV